MSFTGKYELETLETIGLLSAKTDHKVITEVVQSGNDFTWTQSIPNWKWSNTFSIGQECELVTMKGIKFKAPVLMEDGRISVEFPQYHFTAEVNGDTLIMICTTPGEKGVTFKRISRRV